MVDGGGVRRRADADHEEFFALDPLPPIVWLAEFGIAALVWTLARLFLPPERPVGPGVI